MRILSPSFLCLALSMAAAPGLAAAQNYLPLPETNASVYRPVSSYYRADAPATGSALVNRVTAPPVANVDEIPNPGNNVAVESPSLSYSSSVVKGGKSCGKGCGKGGGCGTLGCWYAGANAIWFNRDEADNRCLSVFDNALNVSLLDTQDASMEWTGGGELTIGRYLHGGCSAIEFSYWGINPDAQQASVLDPNLIGVAPNLNSAFDMTTLNYNDGVNPAASIDNWFNGARIHRVRSNYEFDNLELNFVHHSCCGTFTGLCGHCRHYNLSMLAGLRYMMLDESFTFDADDANTIFNGGIEEVRYSIDTDNHLLGFQIGGRGDFYYNDCLAFHSTCKVGIYGNAIDHHSFIGGANGAATVGAGPNAGRAFNIVSDKNDVAMIGELDLGASYRLSCRWRATAGYRVIALSGVALPGDQIPVNFADLSGVASIGSDSSMLLHGGYAGLQFNY